MGDWIWVFQGQDGGYNEAPDGKTTEGDNLTVGDGSVDLKGRPVSKANTGGWKTASLIFGKALPASLNFLNVHYLQSAQSMNCSRPPSLSC